MIQTNQVSSAVLSVIPIDGNVEVVLFPGSWKLFLRGAGGRRQSVKRYDDSTSSEDGHSEYESEGRNSDTDSDIDGVGDLKGPGVGLKLIGKLPSWGLPTFWFWCVTNSWLFQAGWLFL